MCSGTGGGGGGGGVVVSRVGAETSGVKCLKGRGKVGKCVVGCGIKIFSPWWTSNSPVELTFGFIRYAYRPDYCRWNNSTDKRQEMAFVCKTCHRKFKTVKTLSAYPSQGLTGWKPISIGPNTKPWGTRHGRVFHHARTDHHLGATN